MSRVWTIAGLAVSALVLSSCGKKEEAAAPAGGREGAAAGPEKILIGFAQSTMIDPWRINMLKQMQDAVAEHADRVEFIFTDAQNDNLRQIADVEDLQQKGVDVLIISPLEAAPLTPVVSKVYKSGIPVITLDRNITTDDYTCFIGASNVEIGRAAGKLLVEKLGGKGKVVEIEGILGASATIDRHKGFHEVVDQHPGIEIIVDKTGNYLRAEAINVMEDALQAHEQIDAVYAHNDEMALGALKAAKEAGRAEGLIIIGIDGQREAYEAIKRGEMTATFVYPNGSKEAIETAIKIADGQEVPKQIRLQTIQVTAENVDEVYDPDSYF